MVRTAYKVVGDEIVKVDITDTEGVSWREAKKQLRQRYLDAAFALREVTEKTYFGE